MCCAHWGEQLLELEWLQHSNFCLKQLHFFAGGQDLLSDSRDIDALTNALPKEKVVEVLIERSYAHLDFVWGMDAHTLLYPSVKRLLNRYSGQHNSQSASA